MVTQPIQDLENPGKAKDHGEATFHLGPYAPRIPVSSAGRALLPSTISTLSLPNLYIPAAFLADTAQEF
jgi:hypothetical protein